MIRQNGKEKFRNIEEKKEKNDLLHNCMHIKTIKRYY